MPSLNPPLSSHRRYNAVIKLSVLTDMQRFYSTLSCFCTRLHMYPHGVETVLISRPTVFDSLIKKMPGDFVYTVCCGMVCLFSFIC